MDGKMKQPSLGYKDIDFYKWELSFSALRQSCAPRSSVLSLHYVVHIGSKETNSIKVLTELL